VSKFEDEHIEHISPAFAMNLVMLDMVNRYEESRKRPTPLKRIRVKGQVWIWITNRGAIGLRNDQSMKTSSPRKAIPNPIPEDLRICDGRRIMQGFLVV